MQEKNLKKWGSDVFFQWTVLQQFSIGYLFIKNLKLQKKLVKCEIQLVSFKYTQDYSALHFLYLFN